MNQVSNTDNCQRIRDEFSAFLDGELSAEEHTAVESHLAGCADCLRELERLKQVDSLFGAMPREAAPESFQRRVQAAVAENVVPLQNRRATSIPFRLAAFAAAAVMLFAAGTIIIFRGTEPERFKMAADPEAPDPAEVAVQRREAQRDVSIAEESPALESARELSALGYLGDESAEKDETPARGRAAGAGIDSLTDADAVTGPDTEAAPSPEAPVPVRRQALMNESTEVAGQAAPEAGAASAGRAGAAPSDEAAPTPEGDEFFRTAVPPAPQFDSAGAGERVIETQGGEIRVPTRTLPGAVPPAIESQAESDESTPETADALRANEESAQEPSSEAGGGKLSKVFPRDDKPAQPEISSESEARFGDAAAGVDLDRVSRDTNTASPRQQAPEPAHAAMLFGGSFELTRGQWVDTRYAGEPLTDVARDSTEFNEIRKRFPQADELLEWTEPVIFRAENRWYRLPAAAD